MQYLALHHVKIGNQFFTPGEIIDVVIPNEKRERLLENDAIREAGASFSQADESPTPHPSPTAAHSPQGEGKGDVNTLPSENEQPKGEGDDLSPEDTESDGEEPAAMEEAAEDAPEIDAMDGIVSQPKETKAETPRATRSRTPRAPRAETSKAAGRSKKP